MTVVKPLVNLVAVKETVQEPLKRAKRKSIDGSEVVISIPQQSATIRALRTGMVEDIETITERIISRRNSVSQKVKVTSAHVIFCAVVCGDRRRN